MALYILCRIHDKVLRNSTATQYPLNPTKPNETHTHTPKRKYSVVCHLLCLRFENLVDKWVCSGNVGLYALYQHDLPAILQKIGWSALKHMHPSKLLKFLITSPLFFLVNKNERNIRPFTGYSRIWKLIIALTKNFWWHILRTLNDRTFAWD